MMRRKRWQKESMKGPSYLRIGFFREWKRREWDDSNFIDMVEKAVNIVKGKEKVERTEQ
jgi:hypothetical protein